MSTPTPTTMTLAGPDQTTRRFYTVEADSWKIMRARLLLAALDDYPSARQAAKALGVPRTTMHVWVREARELLGDQP